MLGTKLGETIDLIRRDCDATLPFVLSMMARGETIDLIRRDCDRFPTFFSLYSHIREKPLT